MVRRLLVVFTSATLAAYSTDNTCCETTSRRALSMGPASTPNLDRCGTRMARGNSLEFQAHRLRRRLVRFVGDGLGTVQSAESVWPRTQSNRAAALDRPSRV